MEMPVIYVFTHDSIGVGEDGPTHQPIEHLASLRAIPGLIVLRPADANEVVEAWKVIMKLHHEPAALILTRQAVPTIDRTQVRARVGRGPRGVRPGRRAGRQAGRAAAGDRQRGRAVPGGVRAAQGGGHQGAGGEHAVVGDVRGPAAGRTATASCRRAVTARVSVEQASTFGWARTSARRGTASACGRSGRRRR